MNNFMTKMGVLLLAVFASSDSFGEEQPSVEQIIEQVNLRDEGQAVSRTLLMTLTDRRGKTRVRETRAFRKYFGDEKRTAIFYKKPNNIKDTAFLTYDYPDLNKDDDQWLYLPAMRRVRRISAADRGDYFLGTDFSYEDIKLETRISTSDYHHILLGSHFIEKRKYFVLEATPVDAKIAKELGYGKVNTIIDSSNWMITKNEFWDPKGHPLKTIDFSDIRLVQGIWTAHIIAVDNHKTGHKTQFSFSDVDYSNGVNDDVFTTQSIRRGL